MNSWVSVDNDKCNNCGFCVTRCPLCFRKQDDEIVAQVDESNCNLCGHCIALCAVDAIEHSKMDMGNFAKIEKPIMFDTDEFIQFIRERRSHRLFKDKEIPKEILEKLIDTCRYAPTGSNVQNVEILVIQDPEKRQKLSDMTVDYFDELGSKLGKHIERLKADGKEIDENLQRTTMYRDRLMLARKVGYDSIFHKAPAVIIFHSPSQTSAPKDNCVIASTTMGLVARTMGIEFTYIGLFEGASKTHQPIMAELALPEGHEVFSVLIIGYPKLKFRKTTDRELIKTRWE